MVNGLWSRKYQRGCAPPLCFRQFKKESVRFPPDRNKGLLRTYRELGACQWNHRPVRSLQSCRRYGLEVMPWYYNPTRSFGLYCFFFFRSNSISPLFSPSYAATNNASLKKTIQNPYNKTEDQTKELDRMRVMAQFMPTSDPWGQEVRDTLGGIYLSDLFSDRSFKFYDFISQRCSWGLCLLQPCPQSCWNWSRLILLTKLCSDIWTTTQTVVQENPYRANGLAVALSHIYDSPGLPTIGYYTLPELFSLAELADHRFGFDKVTGDFGPTNTFSITGLSLKYKLTDCSDQFWFIECGLNVIDRNMPTSEVLVNGACIQLLIYGSEIVPIDKPFIQSANEVVTKPKTQKSSRTDWTVKNPNALIILEVGQLFMQYKTWAHFFIWSTSLLFRMLKPDLSKRTTMNTSGNFCFQEWRMIWTGSIYVILWTTIAKFRQLWNDLRWGYNTGSLKTLKDYDDCERTQQLKMHGNGLLWPYNLLNSM